MNFNDGPDERNFRLTVHQWLAENAPLPEVEQDRGIEGNRAKMQWHRQLFSGGWLGLSWPKKYGGQGLTPIYDAIVNEEIGAWGVPMPAIGYLGRAILDYGTEEQREEFLGPMLRGEQQWCQGFSEPDAGSDLASLRTSAEQHGDLYVVNGQKVWTSRAQWSDWCLLLCRTNPELPKHKGISCLVLRMDSSGVSVHPLLQTWGDAEFSEVFLEDVQVPVHQRIGAEGDGWAIATTVLAHERGPSDIGLISHFFHLLANFEVMHGSLPSALRLEFSQRIAHAYVSVSACRLYILKSLSLRAKGVPPGPEASVCKLLMTRVEQEFGALAFDLSGSAPLLGEDQDTVFHYLRSRAASIFGGTEQIQRSIVAQRVLGMQRGK